MAETAVTVKDRAIPRGNFWEYVIDGLPCENLLTALALVMERGFTEKGSYDYIEELEKEAKVCNLCLWWNRWAKIGCNHIDIAGSFHTSERPACGGNTWKPKKSSILRFLNSDSTPSLKSAI